MYHELAEGPSVQEKVPQRVFKVANYYIAIFVNIFLLYVLNNLVSNIPHPIDQYASKDYPGLIEKIVVAASNFQVTFLTRDFVSCLWAINLAVTLGILGNFFLLIYRRVWFHHLIQAVICAGGFFAFFLVFKLFPFDVTSAAIHTVIRAVLIMGMAGLGIGLIIELIRFIKSPIFPDKPAPRETDGSGQI